MGVVILISDIDECKSTNNPCSVNETCSNGLGSYNCTCKEGYRREGNLCICKFIRIHHEYEGGIEKFVWRITDWHHEACSFLSHLHTYYGLFFLLTT